MRREAAFNPFPSGYVVKVVSKEKIIFVNFCEPVFHGLIPGN